MEEAGLDAAGQRWRQQDDSRTETKSDGDYSRNAQPGQRQRPDDGTSTPKSDRDDDNDGQQVDGRRKKQHEMTQKKELEHTEKKVQSIEDKE